MTRALRILGLGRDGNARELDVINPPRDRSEWYVFSDPTAVLHPDLMALLLFHGADRPDVGIFYGDEVIAAGPADALRYLCKPSFDATQLMARDYIGLPIAIRAGVLAELGGLDSRAGPAECYDFLLRAMAGEVVIDRITEVLAVNRESRALPSAADRLSALRRVLSSYLPGCQAVPGLAETSFEIRREFEAYPDVTIIIPTRQARPPDGQVAHSQQPMILNLLDGLCRSDWPMDRLSVLIGDDLRDGSIYESRSWPFRLERIVTGQGPIGEFNYAWKINALWRAAGTEHLIVLNDDLLIRGPGWMKALMTFAVDESVGGVGARLLYPNNTIQHAGMPAGVMGTCTHAFIDSPACGPTYQDWAVVQREWSIVTGAVFATRRSVLEQVNGFDERFSLDYNDVDLCLRLRLLGYRIVYTPHAELTHFESASRGKSKPCADQTALFLEKWQDYLNDDPAYHPNLTRTTPDIQPVVPRRAWWSAIAGGRG